MPSNYGAAQNGGVYSSTAPTLSSGQTSRLQLDSAGNLYVNLATLLYGEDANNNVLGVVLKPVIGSAYSLLPFNFTGSAAYQTIKAAPGQLCAIAATNASNALAYLQVYNAASGAPSGVPLIWFPVPAGTANNPGVFPGIALGANGITLSAGLTVAMSSAATTYSAVATPANFSAAGTYY